MTNDVLFDDDEEEEEEEEGRDVEGIPYLTLNVPQTISCSLSVEHQDRSRCEPADFSSVLSMLDHRASYSKDSVAVAFGALEQNEEKEEFGCQEMTYSDVRRTSIVFGRSLYETLSRHPLLLKDDEQLVVGLLFPSGPELLAHILASWRIGCAILPIAVGMTSDGIASLLKSTGARFIFCPNEFAPLMDDVRRCCTAAYQIAALPPLLSTSEDDKENCPLFRMPTSNDILTIFHSSGSSGNPKPIYHPHRFWTRSLAGSYGVRRAAYTTTPLFHGGLSDLLRAFQAGASLYLFPWHSKHPPTPTNIIKSVASAPQPIRYFLSVPFILESLLASTEGRSMLQSMDLVSTGGAPLPAHVGDEMVERYNIKLVSRMGSSECGFLFSSWRAFVQDKGWSWLRIEDKETKVHLTFEERAEDGLFELIVGKQWPNKLLSNRPDGSFATSDLFERHPDMQDVWRYVRRSDDSIVMVNGKKIASTPIESALKGNGMMIEDAIVFGANRPILGAIVQAAHGVHSTDVRMGLDSILESVNRKSPGHAQLVEEMILVVESNDQVLRTLPRSSKGTLQRGLALEQLKEVIERLYIDFDQGTAKTSKGKVTLKSAKEVLAWLQTTTTAMLTGGNNVDKDRIGPDTDLFSVGLDSVLAARLRASVHQHLDLNGFRLPSNAVYECGTLRALANFVARRESKQSGDAKMLATDMIGQYGNFSAVHFHREQEQAINSNPARSTVLLTGATGTLGAHILHALLRDQHNVEHVICQVRAKDNEHASERILHSLERRKLDGIDLSRLSCVTDRGDADLLSGFLQARKSIVIHCAWIVNFAIPLSSFESSSISALHSLLCLFAQCRDPSRFVFCSSLAAVQSSLGCKDGIVEKQSHRFEDAGVTGYGQSKWTAEQICWQAIQRSANVTIARIGQLCGDEENGIWNESEAWPLLVRTANETGTLPRSGPEIDWLPVNVAARTITEIAFFSKSSSPPIVHVALPMSVRRPDWTQFVQWLAKSAMQSFDVIPNEEWIERLKSMGGRIRGRALVPLWSSSLSSSSERGGLHVQTNLAERLSPTLQGSASAVDETLCRKFVDAWHSTGFLSL